MNQELKKVIDKEKYRYYGNEKRPIFYSVRNAQLRYVICFRKASYYQKKNSPLRFWYKCQLRRMEYKLGYEIPVGTQIGEGLRIAHKGNLIIACRSVIGKNVYFSASATIGLQNRGERKGTPTIGDSVWIGANAVIVGKISIGNDVLIAPNAYVNFDVPDDSIVIGNPGKIIHRENATEGYMIYRV